MPLLLLGRPSNVFSEMINEVFKKQFTVIYYRYYPILQTTYYTYLHVIFALIRSLSKGAIYSL